MGNIRVLDELLINKIAAGEVVERPASVVKELLENALDAGATRIEIAIKGGGKSLIRIVDNGKGMDEEDALLAVQRHATSKIFSIDDLTHIKTLGFRGEALSSISAVSRFRMITLTEGAGEAVCVVCEGPTKSTQSVAGHAAGTSIEVRDLFFNTPARKKFMKSFNAEYQAIYDVVLRIALPHPQVALTLSKDDKTVLKLLPVDDVRHRIKDLLGKEVSEQLIAVESDGEFFNLQGWIGKPTLTRINRTAQYFFLDGRSIHSQLLSYTVRRAMGSLIEGRRFPVVFMMIRTGPGLVDVNVHPQKKEVRFSDETMVKDIVSRAVSKALRLWTQDSPPGFDVASLTVGNRPACSSGGRVFPEQDKRSSVFSRNSYGDRGDKMIGGSRSDNCPRVIPEKSGIQKVGARHAVPLPCPSPQPMDVNETLPMADEPALRVLGQAAGLYIVAEGADGIVILDQHAAHERVLFERMTDEIESGGVASQQLLLSFTKEFAQADIGLLSEQFGYLQRLGFEVELFGPTSVKIDAVPVHIDVATNLDRILQDLVDELKQHCAGGSMEKSKEEIIARTVCRRAVMAHDSMPVEQQKQLVKDLLACRVPHTCPHGRPTMIRLDRSYLEKEFKRR